MCLLLHAVPEALDHYDGGVRQVFGEKGTGAIWATYPQPYVSTWSGLGDQVRQSSGQSGHRPVLELSDLTELASLNDQSQTDPDV